MFKSLLHVERRRVPFGHTRKDCGSRYFTTLKPLEPINTRNVSAWVVVGRDSPL